MGGCLKKKKWFSALWASVWCKCKGDPPLDPPLFTSLWVGWVLFVEFWSSAVRRISQPGGIPLGILGGAVPPGSSNPDPLRPKNVIFTPVFTLFRPGF